jgi:hypothetical protein
MWQYARFKGELLMKVYVFKKFSRIQRILADEYEGHLTWPGTRIPYLDQDRLSVNSNRNQINALLNQAEESETVCDQLWKNSEILEITLKAKDSVS